MRYNIIVHSIPKKWKDIWYIPIPQDIKHGNEEETLHCVQLCM
jgi:hypothetical protein